MGKRRGSGAHGDPMVTGAVSAKWSKGTGGPAGDECYNLVPALADPITANEGSTYTHEGKNFRLRNVVAFDETQITHPENRSQPDDRAPQLASAARPPTIAFSCKDYGNDATEDVSPPLRAMNDVDGNANAGGQLAIAFKPSHYTRGKDGAPSGVAPPLGAEPDKGDQDAVLMTGAAVRRLTPRECERLQAYPDDYTLVNYRGKPAADGPRYRALGNSMNVKDIRAILQRIELFERTVR